MSNNMNNECIQMFCAPIQKTVLELNIDSLIEFCYEMKRKDEKGVERSNLGGWQSNDIIHETHTEFVKLKNKIEEAANIYHHNIQLKKIYKQKISNIWVNINQKGHSNINHNHPFSILSGAFYLTKGETTPINFEHPYKDINLYFWPPSIIESPNSVNTMGAALANKANELIIFPAWLYHKVSTNKEDIDRITFSFNTTLSDKFAMRYSHETHMV